MLDHHRSNRRDLNHLMAHWGWILPLQHSAAAAADLGEVLHHLVNPLNRQQLRASAGLARLTAALAASTFAPLGRLETQDAAGGRFGGVEGAAGDALTQAGQQFGG
jgi:hypothetical protein